MASKQFVLDVYRAITKPRRYYFNTPGDAIKFGDTVWNNNSMNAGSIYKIKLWDLSKGKIEANKPNARALLREWI